MSIRHEPTAGVDLNINRLGERLKISLNRNEDRIKPFNTIQCVHTNEPINLLINV